MTNSQIFKKFCIIAQRKNSIGIEKKLEIQD